MYAKVVIDQDAKALDRTFEYRTDRPIPLGTRVNVPFGARVLQGVVVGLCDSAEFDENKIKPILSCVEDYPVVKGELLQVMNFMAEKFHLKLAHILRLFLPTELREGKQPLQEIFFVLSENYQNLAQKLQKNAKKQQDLINYLQKNGQGSSTELKNLFGSALSALEKKGIVTRLSREKLRTPQVSLSSAKAVTLSQQQQKVVEAVSGSGTFLLHGVTGSGKTEVYMHLISKVLQEGKNAIMLVPEISLTPQIMGSFKARFGAQVALLHSGLSAGERFDEWRRLFSGEAKIAIGARSAIFAPLENLGIIIIDEEHEQSYISESNPRYSTHEVAAERARLSSCPLLLGSATPSIESYQKAKRGEYTLLEMPLRANGKDMPAVEVVDMVAEIRRGNSDMFSALLIASLADIVRRGKQAMLFVNRRGYASFLRCRECGYVAKCTDCDVSLVYHKEDMRLKCHYCGKQFEVPSVCPSCGSAQIRRGAVGTEQVVEHLKELFAGVKVLRMDNDSTRTKNAYQKILDEFRTTHPCFLVGTQMIAKGHDFEDVLLVGVVDADQSVYQSDYRATERTFQLITQVAGRAGRGCENGKVILQTYSPKHYVYKFVSNYDYKNFFKKEENIRQTTAFPPFSRIIRLLFADSDENYVRDCVKMCYNEIVKLKSAYPNQFLHLDAMRAPIKRMKNKVRFQIIMRLNLEKADEIEKKVFEIADKISKNSVFFEINPQNLS